MGEVSEDRPGIIYVSAKGGKQKNCEAGLMEVYSNGMKKRVKAWKGWLCGFEYKTHEEYGVELAVVLGEGSTISKVQMLLKSGQARSFMRAIENVDLRKPITFRPWGYTEEGVDENKNPVTLVKIGALNMEQGGRSIAYKYTKETPGEMPPPEEVENDDGTKRMSFAKQTAFLRNILDTVIAPQVAEILKNNLYEDEDVSTRLQIGPGRTTSQKQLSAASESLIQLPPASGDAPVPEGSEEDDDLPF